MALTLPELGLVGRERELDVLAALVAGIPDRGGALVVRGDPGVGKSTLLAAAQARAAEHGVAVLSTSGVESEAHLPFAGLHQLLRPARPELGRLPTRQRGAIEAAFGLADAEAPDFFLVALATLELLGDAASPGSLLLVVDDAHWLDRATSDVLAFVARRLELEPIAAVLAVRAGSGDRISSGGLPELVVDRLPDGPAAELLAAAAPELDAKLRARVLAEALGNPLALVELPRAWGTRDASASLLSETLPLTERLEQAFADRVGELPGAAQALTLVAALDDRGDLGRVTSAAAALDAGLTGIDAVSAAAAAHLVTVDGATLRFRHPLVRSAVRQRASLAQRRAAHAALAAAYVDDPDRAVWHRAAALVAPADDVVEELEEAAARAQRRGAPASAAAALERGAQLTSDDAKRGALLVKAAEIEFELGRLDTSRVLLREAQGLALADRDRTRLAFLREVLLDSGWSGAGPVGAFVEIADELIGQGEPRQALDALMTVALRCWWGNPDQKTRDLVVAAAGRIPVEPDDPTLLAVLALADPVRTGAAVVDHISATSPASPRDASQMFLLGTAAAAAWAQSLALPYFAAAVDGYRAQGRLALVAQALVSQAWSAVHLANAQIASPAAAEAVRLGEETGQPRWAAAARLAQSTMAAERGDFALAEALAAEAEAELLPTGTNPMLALVQFARGRAAVAQGRLADLYGHVRRIFDPDDIAYHPFVRLWAVADLVDAAVHGGGDLGFVRTALADLEQVTAATQAPFLRVQLSYVRPLLAEDADAERLFQDALSGDLATWPCFRGRLLLAYGAWLRRQRRVAESRAPLRAAGQVFDALGFVTMSERARQELRASGETSRRRTPDGWDQLTPQELQIAQLAASGMTNREIGQRLYLSHRTIGSHLYRIFPKLGVTSRSQLSSALAASTAA
jgi:DNA-binding CsgD family transcriptional regulator